MAVTSTIIRAQFFDYLFGDDEGYLCIATANPDKSGFKQQFFKWPEQRKELTAFLDVSELRKNVWFCTSLLERPIRKKEFCLPGCLVWADLDGCHPDVVEPDPSCVIETSPRRFQAIWRLDQQLEPYEQEDFSKRIAYLYSDRGADPSGWDLTQLLRVPLTFNYKYEPFGDVPYIDILKLAETRAPKVLFSAIPRPVDKATESTSLAAESLPHTDELPTAEMVLYRYYAQISINHSFKQLYQTEPDTDEDWSRNLWRLLNICMEIGMSDVETFVIGLTSKCNKYARDNRPVVHLWQDVLRASAAQKRIIDVMAEHEVLVMPELVTTEEIAELGPSFISDYATWAEEATDAVAVYHELAAFILLSSTMASGIVLKTSYGDMTPNLWGLVLGDSTLTRKTTAMRMAMDMLTDIDGEVILATDGSAEGLLTGLSTRPNRVSVFFKDEVSGFFDSINRKDYLAGMPETLTQLYDVPRVFTRRLRKEVIVVSNPVFIFFGGGIRDKVFSLLDDEYILSGFLPRFLIVSGEADLTRVRRTGPGTGDMSIKREEIQQRIANLYEQYNRTVTISIGGQQTEITAKNEARLTDGAWLRYGDIEAKMVEAAHESSVRMVALPTFERLSRSLLKMAVLLAASRSSPKEGIFLVEEQDIIRAAMYIQDWGRFTIELLLNAGKGQTEKLYDRVLKHIESSAEVSKSLILRRFHLSKREADDILSTLEERGQIIITKTGRNITLTAI